MKTNRYPSSGASAPLRTEGGGKADRVSNYEALHRMCMTALLWEKDFNQSEIDSLVKKLSFEEVAQIAREAKHNMHLRHLPLYLAVLLCDRKQGAPMGDLICDLINRPDELTEFLSIYWRNGKVPIAKQVKRGLALAFTKFSEYQLAKYNRNEPIKLKDVMFLVHPRPKDSNQEALWNKFCNSKLSVPDTWEVAISRNGNNLHTWERLMAQNALGCDAFIMNLRNILNSGVDIQRAIEYAYRVNVSKLLPHSVYGASQFVDSSWHCVLDILLKRLVNPNNVLPGKTVFIVDVSGSMAASLSFKKGKKSPLRRIDVAASLTAMISSVCEDYCVYITAGNDILKKHATMKIQNSAPLNLARIVSTDTPQHVGYGGIFLTSAMSFVANLEKSADRVIVLTDEQDCSNSREYDPSKAHAFGNNNYLINVAPKKNGIGYTGKWHHINGWSNTVLEYIKMYESNYVPALN